MLCLAFRRMLACRIWLFVIILLAPGCGKSDEGLPKTYAVHGKVVGKDGKPFGAGGAILFRPVADQEVQASGAIAEDGTFTLHSAGRTSRGRSTKLEGTIEGECKVQVEPPMGSGR